MTIRVIGALLLAGALGCVAENLSIEGTGFLEIVEVDVAPTSSARIERMYVQEGDRVSPGDTIAVLTIPTLAADAARARADEARARANHRELVAGSRDLEIERAKAELVAREAELRRAVDDTLRLAPLVAQRLASDAEMTTARSAAQFAQAQRDGAVAALTLLREGTRAERIAAAEAEVQRAAAALAAVSAIARDLVLTSPIAGVVMSRNAEPGEVVPSGRAVATLGETARQWVRVYLGPQHIPAIAVGDTVIGTLDAFPDRPFRGRVTAIATEAEFTPRVALTETERADLLYAVRVDFDDSSGTLKAGLPITVRFPHGMLPQ